MSRYWFSTQGPEIHEQTQIKLFPKCNTHRSRWSPDTHTHTHTHNNACPMPWTKSDTEWPTQILHQHCHISNGLQENQNHTPTQIQHCEAQGLINAGSSPWSTIIQSQSSHSLDTCLRNSSWTSIHTSMAKAAHSAKRYLLTQAISALPPKTAKRSAVALKISSSVLLESVRHAEENMNMVQCLPPLKVFFFQSEIAIQGYQLEGNLEEEDCSPHSIQK